MSGTLTDNIERVRTEGDIAYSCTDTYVVTNPAWNKRLSELENWDTLSGTPGWAASFIAYMEDELLAAATPTHATAYPDSEFLTWDCDVSDPKLGRKSDRYYFEVTWF